MHWVSQIAFLLLLATAVWFFVKRVKFIRRNILLGRDTEPAGNSSERLKTMIRVALGQSKMTTRPVAAIFHILIYAGFVLINIEMLEIIIDGLAGTHRIAMPLLGSLYGFMIGFFEILAVGVIAACAVFLFRREVVKVGRFRSPELKGFPLFDARAILITEIVLMVALLCMNALDEKLQTSFTTPVSFWFSPSFSEAGNHYHLIERVCWWIHIIGVFLFLNYVPFSKHWHIIMSFPNTYYTPLKPKGEFEINNAIKTEVSLMLDPAAVPPEGYEAPVSFGARDVKDLTWKNLMDAYTCTECGRCTSVCPANLTGKKLSPRKVMMDTRDRLEEYGKNLDTKGADFNDEKDLHSYISAEELWACTTCNACAEACPININPVDIIVQMRQYQVMEKSAAPAELNAMFTNLENNGAPWQFSQMDRANWATDN